LLAKNAGLKPNKHRNTDTLSQAENQTEKKIKIRSGIPTIFIRAAAGS
jgi:hypothetical protein